MRIGVLFPGQGAQFVGMGADVFQAVPELLGDAASEALGWSLQQMCAEGPEAALTLTQHAQPALYGVSYGLWDLFARQLPEGVSVVAGAGHSLGEFTALAAAGVLDFFDGLRLVAARGQAMGIAASAEPSAMAALIGADEEKSEQLASARRSDGGQLWVANINAPSQVVVAGGVDDIEWAGEHVRDFKIRRAIPLKVAGAFHTPFMESAVEQLGAAVAEVVFGDSTFEVYANTTARPYGSDVATTLVDQIVGQVRFQDLLVNMAEHVDALVHVGPGDVTAGMAKRSTPDTPIFVINDLESLAEVTAALGGKPNDEC